MIKASPKSSGIFPSPYTSLQDIPADAFDAPNGLLVSRMEQRRIAASYFIRRKFTQTNLLIFIKFHTCELSFFHEIKHWKKTLSKLSTGGIEESVKSDGIQLLTDKNEQLSLRRRWHHRLSDTTCYLYALLGARGCLVHLSNVKTASTVRQPSW